MKTEGLYKRSTHLGTSYFQNSNGDIVAKCCNKCGEIKLIESFTKQKDGIGGKTSRCKDCVKEYREQNKERQAENFRKWRENNKDRHLENALQWQRDNPDKVALRNKKWRESNPKKMSEITREWYEKNKERKSETDRRWVSQNHEQKLLQTQRRRSRIKSLPSTLTQLKYRETLDYFNHSCALTGRKNTEIEHAIPTAIGHGGTTFENCYPMANGLNQSKGNKNIFEWFEANRQRFELSQERFDNLIAYLASANAMTVEEYRDYVYWCHANPRSTDEINEIDGGNRQAN